MIEEITLYFLPFLDVLTVQLQPAGSHSDGDDLSAIRRNLKIYLYVCVCIRNGDLSVLRVPKSHGGVNKYTSDLKCEYIQYTHCTSGMNVDSRVLSPSLFFFW